MATQSTLADFEFLGRLGRGAFGEVHKVRRKVDDQIYVIKQIHLSDLDESGQRDAVRECHLMASIDSPFVCRYYDSFLTGDGTLCIVMQFCDRGDLQRMVRKQAGSPLPEERVWNIVIQIMLGLCHLHDRRILHRDLKTANVFLQSGDKVCVGDLGVARVLGTDSFFAKTVAGTPYYLSPEICEGSPYNQRSDVWALGCIVYELCSLRHAFDAKNQGALIMKIIKGEYPPIPAMYSERMRRLVDTLLDRDSRRRPMVAEVLADNWIFEKAKSLGFTLPESVVALHDSHAALSSASHAHTHAHAHAGDGDSDSDGGDDGGAADAVAAPSIAHGGAGEAPSVAPESEKEDEKALAVYERMAGRTHEEASFIGGGNSGGNSSTIVRGGHHAQLLRAAAAAAVAAAASGSGGGSGSHAGGNRLLSTIVPASAPVPPQAAASSTSSSSGVRGLTRAPSGLSSTMTAAAGAGAGAGGRRTAAPAAPSLSLSHSSGSLGGAPLGGGGRRSRLKQGTTKKRAPLPLPEAAQRAAAAAAEAAAAAHSARSKSSASASASASARSDKDRSPTAAAPVAINAAAAAAARHLSPAAAPVPPPQPPSAPRSASGSPAATAGAVSSGIADPRNLESALLALEVAALPDTGTIKQPSKQQQQLSSTVVTQRPATATLLPSLALPSSTASNSNHNATHHAPRPSVDLLRSLSAAAEAAAAASSSTSALSTAPAPPATAPAASEGHEGVYDEEGEDEEDVAEEEGDEEEEDEAEFMIQELLAKREDVILRLDAIRSQCEGLGLLPDRLFSRLVETIEPFIERRGADGSYVDDDDDGEDEPFASISPRDGDDGHDASAEIAPSEAELKVIEQNPAAYLALYRAEFALGLLKDVDNELRALGVNEVPKITLVG